MMACPYCQSGVIWYGDTVIRHYFRMSLGSRKRYCPSCHKKWIVRPRCGRSENRINSLIVILIIASSVLGSVAFANISTMLDHFRSEAGNSGPDPMQLYMSKMKQMENNPGMQKMAMGGGADQKKMIEQALKQYGK